MNITRTLTAAGMTVAALVMSACGGVTDPLVETPAAPSGFVAEGGPVVVGSVRSTESEILAELYAQALLARGIQASTKPGLGSREASLEALQDTSVSVVPEFTGNLLLQVDQAASATTASEVEEALPAALAPTGLTVLTSSPAADQDVYVVTREFSKKNGVTSLEDLQKVPGQVVLGGPSELAQQPYGPVGLESIYGAKVKRFTAYETPAQKTRDLLDGTIQLATYVSTEGVIADHGLVPLADPQAMILPQNVIPLVSAAVAGNTAAVSALDAVQAALTTEDLAALNATVDSLGQDPHQVAADWLQTKSLG